MSGGFVTFRPVPEGRPDEPRGLPPCVVCGEPAGCWDWDPGDPPCEGERGWWHCDTWGSRAYHCSHGCYLKGDEWANSPHNPARLPASPNGETP